MTSHIPINRDAYDAFPRGQVAVYLLIADGVPRYVSLLEKQR